jgi:hypothetical protein
MPEENQLPEIRLIATRNVPLGWAVESQKSIGKIISYPDILIDLRL